MENKVIDCKEIKSKDLLSADEVIAHIKKIQKKYPLGYKYPSEEFPIMYIDALGDYDNNRNSRMSYEALSWIGLKNTVAWNNLTGVQQTNIDSQIQNALQDASCN